MPIMFFWSIPLVDAALDYEALESAFIQACEQADMGLFAQGDILLLAREAGYDMAALCRSWESIAKVSRRTLYNRLKVAAVFAPPQRVERPGLWSLYMAACAGVDLDVPDTYIAAHARMDKALDQNWTLSQLKSAIAAERGKADKPAVAQICRGVDCRAVGRDGGRVTLLLDPAVAAAIPVGKPLVLSLFAVQAVAQMEM
ncbi:MAG: hypothetical protein HXY38_15055 [Chloroflexi bacterium]|nr:hypothetical protein [Chloroflexota bacterium]